MVCKYLILGDGFIGNKFKNFLEDSFLSKDWIKDVSSVESEIQKHSPEVVINCIGQTGTPNIDWCEDNKSETLYSNVLVPVYIAEACQKTGKKMVHLGSGCIYEGNNNGRGFSEEDESNYHGSFYSETKIMSEMALKGFDNVLQVRIRMPIDSVPSSRNFITKILSYNKLIDIKNSMSIINDMLSATKQLIEKNQKGIFNLVNQRPISHKEILDIYQEISGKTLNYQVISLEELHKMTKAKRSNCVLSTRKLEKVGIEIPEMKESLKKCLTKYIELEDKK